MIISSIRVSARCFCTRPSSIGKLVARQNPILFQNVRWINISGDSGKQGGRYRRTKERSPFGYFFLFLPVATFCLGTWQVYRRQWKLDLIEKLEALIKNDPVDLSECFSKSLSDCEYVKVKVKGHFDVQATAPLFIFPRSLIVEQKKSSNTVGGGGGGRDPGTGLISTSNQSNIGVHMIVPFEVTDVETVQRYREELNPTLDGSLRILVNVGWLPRSMMEKLKDAGPHKSKQELELIGVLRKSEKREAFQNKADFNFGHWNRRDIGKMSRELGTEPIFLDAYDSYELEFEGQADQRLLVQPVGRQTRINLRNEHLSYIFTWYSLTGIFGYLWYAKIFKPRI